MSNRLINEAKKRLRNYTLDQLLEEIAVMDEWENDISEPMIKDGWIAVSDDTGIIAYFTSLDEALHFRLDYINRILN
jgi:endonuclease YncB( thermonuclease family)